ncbi:uncharacterized protein F5147DRAFT_649851 [Suillus discolor]|uniref:Uncharacterized protein n=1 Tax=Suillus discolor TaxID=1912936 RepID=A0A9P7JXR0_9AGAM|nr:uncharacterized protein F5147DRAFT_649851 [Suillus discolor]KAG2114689.1 hypothetical protein F5147DRAFT_649851 [Suillus discolor]
MPQGSQSLLDRSWLPNGDAVSDINHSEEVIGCKYKGEKYYMGLLLKVVHRDFLELVICPHADNIRLYLQSEWGQSFLKTTVVMFSMQFLHIDDWAMIVRGDLSSETGQVSDTIRVIHPLKEELEVSKYYLDHCPLSHTLQAQLPPQQLFRPSPDIDVIQIGDSINVLVEEHMEKSGIMCWLSKRGNYLWFQDRLLNIPVPVFMQDSGYDVKPGDVMRVAHGPEYLTKGVVQSVDFLNARLTLLSEIDHSLINVPIRFVIKVQNASLDSFKKDIRQEVFIIGGDCKGYQATLQQRTTIQLKDIANRYGMRLNGVMLKGTEMICFCEMWRNITPPPEKVPLSASTVDMSSSVWTTWTDNSEDVVTAGNPSSSLPSQPAASDPWSVNINDMLDSINAGREKPKETLIAWLMNKEFSFKFTTYHMMLKVSPSFIGGRLHNLFCLLRLQPVQDSRDF